MAELAFEVLARMAIMVVTLSLIIAFIHSLFSSTQSSIETGDIVKLDLSHLPPEALRDVVEKCKASGALNKDCAILLNVGEEDREFLEEMGVEIRQRGSTALLSISDGALVLR